MNGPRWNLSSRYAKVEAKGDCIPREQGKQIEWERSGAYRKSLAVTGKAKRYKPSKGASLDDAWPTTRYWPLRKFHKWLLCHLLVFPPHNRPTMPTTGHMHEANTLHKHIPCLLLGLVCATRGQRRSLKQYFNHTTTSKQCRTSRGKVSYVHAVKRLGIFPRPSVQYTQRANGAMMYHQTLLSCVHVLRVWERDFMYCTENLGMRLRVLVLRVWEQGSGNETRGIHVSTGYIWTQPLNGSCIISSWYPKYKAVSHLSKVINTAAVLVRFASEALMEKRWGKVYLVQSSDHLRSKDFNQTTS